MKTRRHLLVCVLVALATMALMAIACAPGLGPPFDKALAEGLFWIGIGTPIMLPLLTAILALLCRFVPIRTPILFAVWLTGWSILAVWSWVGIDATSDFHQFISAADLRSLKVLRREQWTSFGDG
jgi:hypothetical protein